MELITITNLTLGSLFDGIGVFLLAAQRNDITPLWASEIEKAPIRITKRQFPNMIHLGDLTKLQGGKVPPVDIVPLDPLVRTSQPLEIVKDWLVRNPIYFMKRLELLKK